MDEILVTIYVLSLQKEFDLFLPINIHMNDAMNLIQMGIQELDDNYEIIPNPILYCENFNQVINMNNTVKFSGLQNGCKVLIN